MKDRDDFVSLGRVKKGIDLSQTSAGFKISRKKIEWVPSPKAGCCSDDEEDSKEKHKQKNETCSKHPEKRRRIVIRKLKKSRMSVKLEVR